MDIYDSVFELLDLRSFSNLWYWIALAVMWSSLSHFVIGVPWDMAQRARRNADDAQVQHDFEEMVRICCGRVCYIMDKSGLVLTGIVFFVLASLITAGFVLGNEFSQAVLLLIAPACVVGMITVRAARKLLAEPLQGESLYKHLFRLRLGIQGIGTVAIFITAVWGMLQNMNMSVLGG